ncbi:hypothetical protein DTO96_100453 [Ephemeroptericola cinctiostellae]|uniref:Uncharacterized protein n=1 Tax=Ephemeroptericola cinctiostellae TaxID=2268024 RepID=A0A345D8Q5_9BURK|nr:hypothetical protein [Ephemeroptericola cinctiostellae]AXF84743.1 hypothetical protein DTO96_100453 [Ephemeroptericola cinctiostellae]
MMIAPPVHITALSSGEDSFSERMLLLTHGIRSLGYDVTSAHALLNPNAINIVLGSHSSADPLNSWTRLSQLASDIIIYNWELAANEATCFNQRYVRQMIHTHVWDAHLNNVHALRHAGVHDIHHVPMAYVADMHHVPTVAEQDIDVLLYGVMRPRHQTTVDALRAKGLNVQIAEQTGWTNQGLDALIARSKIILNMHRSDSAKAIETSHMAYPLVHRKVVIAETFSETDMDDDICAAVLYGHTEQLPQLCWDLAHDDARRHELERNGFELFSQHSAARTLIKPAIERYLAQSKLTPPEIGNLINHSVALPTTLQLGAGEAWHYSYCNVDARADFAPDLPIDIGAPLPFGQSLNSWRFGQTMLEPAYFDKIIAKDVFQRVKDFKQSLKNCLDLLKDGGTLHISVPLDLSYDAWSHIDDRRAFNDTTWEHIVNDFWLYGFNTHRFDIIETGYGVNNAYGVAVLTDNGGDWLAGRRTPRVVDRQNLVLRKRPLNEEDQGFLLQPRFMD